MSLNNAMPNFDRNDLARGASRMVSFVDTSESFLSTGGNPSTSNVYSRNVSPYIIRLRAYAYKYSVILLAAPAVAGGCHGVFKAQRIRRAGDSTVPNLEARDYNTAFSAIFGQNKDVYSAGGSAIFGANQPVEDIIFAGNWKLFAQTSGLQCNHNDNGNGTCFVDLMPGDYLAKYMDCAFTSGSAISAVNVDAELWITWLAELIPYNRGAT